MMRAGLKREEGKGKGKGQGDEIPRSCDFLDN